MKWIDGWIKNLPRYLCFVSTKLVLCYFT